MYLKTYVLLLLLGLSLALPQDAAKKEAPKKEAPKKPAEPAKPQDAKVEAKPDAEVEVKPDAKPAIPEEAIVEEEVPVEEEEPIDGEFGEEEQLLDEGEEIPPEEEIEEFSCEYTDTTQAAITVYFIKDEQGAEQATEIVPVELTETIDEKLKECLQQDLTGRRNVKRRRRPPVRRRRPNRRRPGSKRKGLRRSSSVALLRDLRRKLSGHPNGVTVTKVKQAMKLAQRYIALRAKEARKKKIIQKRRRG